MIQVMQSAAGIQTQLVAALIFQLLGVYLVVRGLRRSAKFDRTLINNLIVIGNVWDEIDEDAGPEALRIAGGDEVWAGMIQPVVAVDMRVRNVQLAVREMVGHKEATGEPSRVLTWLGPVSLTLGIVFAFTAGISAIQ